MAERILNGFEYLMTEVNKDDLFTPEDFTDEQKQIAETTEQFVLNEVVPHYEEFEKQNFSKIRELFVPAAELGLLSMDVPEDFDGLELDKVTSMLVCEKMARGGGFSSAFVCHTGIGTLPLVYYGTKEQKEKYFPKLTSGEWVGAYCLTEPGSGSDALGAKTSAILSDCGKYYTLNGTKQFITNGGYADLYTVFAKIDKEHFTGFLVERQYEGVSVGPEENKMGIKGSSTTQVILDNVKVPVENLLGEIGRGHKIAFNILNVGRLKLGPVTVGSSKVALSDAVKYANERKQFGQVISSFGAIAEKLADITTGIFASEATSYRICGLLDTKIATLDTGMDGYYKEYLKVIEEYSGECAIAKVFCTEVLAEVADEALQIYGGYGFCCEYPAERLYRDERINRLFEGTNEINRIIIPGTFLGKALKGEFPLEDAAKKAFAAITAQESGDIDTSIPFAQEKDLLRKLKEINLVLIGTAALKYKSKLKHEQEFLLAAADLAIQIFAIESAVLRAEKSYDAVSADKKELLRAVTQVFTFSASEKFATAARKAAFFVEEGAALKIIMNGISRFTYYDASGILASKRLLASAVIEAEKYVF